MRCPLLLLAVVSCSSGSLLTYPTDLELVTKVSSGCVDSVAAVCRSAPVREVSLNVIGGGEGAWLVRSLLESALLGGCVVRETPQNSRTYTLEVRVADLGVRYRQTDHRGLLLSPWVLRQGSCTLVARLVSPEGEVVAHVRASQDTAQWTPASRLSSLASAPFSPPSSPSAAPALVAPLVVAGTVGALLALFFATSE